MKQWIQLAGALLLGGLSGAALAQTSAPSASGTADAERPENSNIGRWYQVEIVLFERLDGSHQEETWPKFPDLSGVAEAQQLQQIHPVPGPTPGVQAATELGPLAADNSTAWPVRDRPGGEERPFVLAPASALSLTEEAARLDAGRNRRVLLHLGWNMPVQGEDSPDRIHLFAARALHGRALVDGTLSIHVGRYLHVATNLYATKYELTKKPLRLFFADRPAPAVRPQGPGPGPWQPELRYPGVGQPTLAPQWVPTESIAFQGARRMRSNELHYLDHPYFGLLIRFTPYTPAHLEDEDTPATDQDQVR